jgi:hypothetical protein
MSHAPPIGPRMRDGRCKGGSLSLLVVNIRERRVLAHGVKMASVLAGVEG